MVKLRSSVSLHDYTTFRIGGQARWFAEPVSAQEIAEAVAVARDQAEQTLVLGNGSNVLVSDTGWPGVAIAITGPLSGVEWNGCEAIAGAGCMLDRLVREAIDRGCAGMEELSGIPGTIGGAVVMNAGAFSDCIADTIVSAEYVGFDDPVPVTVDREGLRLGYRTSIFKDKQAVVVAARFRFTPGDTDLLKNKRREILEKRRGKQPLDLPNCGSVFKRPAGNYAGALIEQAGLKGFRYGNAAISEKHANFIVNLGNATAAQVRHLIVLAQKKVYERSGVLLEPEVIFAGLFDEPLFTPAATESL